MTSYRTAPLATVATVKSGFAFKSSGWLPEGVPVIKIANVKAGTVDTQGCSFVGADTAAQASAFELSRGDIVVAMTGYVGEVAQVRSDDRMLLNQRVGKFIVVQPETLDHGFLYQFLRMPSTKAAFELMAYGSAQPNIGPTQLLSVELPLPEVSEQRAIAEVLGVLDDKIAANTKLAQLMEDLLALEVHEKWLGDRSDRNMSDSLAILDLIEINPTLKRPTESEPIYLDMKKLPEVGSGIVEWDHRPAQGGARFGQGDTLLARITPCLQNRKTGFVDFLTEDQIAVGSTEFIVMRSRPGVSKPISYFVSVNSDFRDFAIRHMVGTSGRQRVSAADIALYKIPRPDPEWLKDFGLRAERNFELMKSLRDESRTLAETRDTLLPQLMSGELRVRDAEKSIEATL